MVRTLWTGLGLTVMAVALAACADDPDADAATKPDPARLAAVAQLNAERYTTIERLYVASVLLDPFNRPDAAPSDADVERAKRAVQRACEGMDVGDALLGLIRAACPAVTGLLDATVAVGAGRKSDDCTDALKRMREVVGEVDASSRDADRAVALARLRAACKRALTTPAVAYPIYRRMDAVLGKMLDALESESADELAGDSKR